MKNYRSENGFLSALLLLAVAFFLGTLAGCLLVGAVNGGGNDTLAAYLQRYLTVAKESQMVAPSIPALLWDLLRWPALAVLFGFTALGVFGLPVLFAVRGFLLSFAIASFVHMFGAAGCVLALPIFGVSGVLAIPVLFVLGVQGWDGARTLATRVSGERKRMFIFGRAYFVRCGVCAGALCLCVILERFVVPPILLGAARLLSNLG